jgi:hypothetical protein
VPHRADAQHGIRKGRRPRLARPCPRR